MYLNSDEDEMFLRMALKNHPRMPRNKRFIMYEMMEKFPMGHWAKLCASDEYVKIPPNFKWSEEENEAPPEAAANRPKEERQTFHYARIETLHCIDDDLNFCEGLSKAYHRILEDRGEKIFLRGNIFLAKMAKSIFEQNENLFAEACEEYADKDYFNECAKTLVQWNFIIKEGDEFNKDSWISLYKVVLLLTEEYLATKSELPKVEALECKENSEDSKKLEIIIVEQDSVEEDLSEASMVPLMIDGMRSLDDSSDNIKVGELFYSFLSDNFPYKDNQSNLTEFMGNIYGKEAGDNFNCNDTTVKSLPRPEFKIETMENKHLGSYKDNTIFLSQHLVLDAISKHPEACFLLLLTMLLEYGRFLNEVLRGKPSDDSGSNEGIDFAIKFMEYLNESLLKKEGFKFADLSAPDAKCAESKFTIEVSGLSYDDRQSIFSNLKSARVKEEEA